MKHFSLRLSDNPRDYLSDYDHDRTRHQEPFNLKIGHGLWVLLAILVYLFLPRPIPQIFCKLAKNLCPHFPIHPLGSMSLYVHKGCPMGHCPTHSLYICPRWSDEPCKSIVIKQINYFKSPNWYLPEVGKLRWPTSFDDQSLSQTVLFGLWRWVSKFWKQFSFQRSNQNEFHFKKLKTDDFITT